MIGTLYKKYLIKGEAITNTVSFSAHNGITCTFLSQLLFV